MEGEHRLSQEAAARELEQATRQASAVKPLRNRIQDSSVESAYAIQELQTRAGLADGRRLVGRKIGLTSAAVRRQLGVDRPDFGMLFEDMNVPTGELVASGRLIQPKVEGEVAFLMGRELVNDPMTLADAVHAVEAVCAAIEIVDSRIENWDIGLFDTVADNGSSGLYVLGRDFHSLPGLDLETCGMVLDQDGEAVSFGVGAACLGHPLQALVWLARTMISCGRPLGPGDIVLSGALGPMVAARPGSVHSARISGLGSVQVAFPASPSTH